MFYLRIPMERIGVLVGKKGEVKAEIEKRSGVRLEIDSEDGAITVNEEKATEPVLALKAVDVVKAIGRGFSPETAFRLFSEDIYLELLDIRDYTGKNQKHVRRVRARVIGTKGKTRRIVEELSNAGVSIYGNTVAIIGGLEEVDIAKTAMDMLLSGSEHSTVYAWLEHQRRGMRLAEMGLQGEGIDSEEEPEDESEGDSKDGSDDDAEGEDGHEGLDGSEDKDTDENRDTDLDSDESKDN